MTTSACGIDCTVCRLHVKGICSTCGAGTSLAAREKLAAQQRLFGESCGVLACAISRCCDHCLRDCDDFPCEWFSSGPHPFSQSFLNMQARRRQNGAQPNTAWPPIANRYWQELAAKEPDQVCRDAQVSRHENVYRLTCLAEDWLVDPNKRSISKVDDVFCGEWDRQIPFFILAYLACVGPRPVSGQMVHPRDLVRGQDCFRGQTQIEVDDLTKRFGTDPQRFLSAAQQLDATRLDLADAAVRLFLFPKVPIDILLWIADEEFPARLSYLLDRDTLYHLPVEGVALCINLLGRRLLFADRNHAEENAPTENTET